MPMALVTIAIALYGWAPTAARQEQVARFLRQGPRISANLMEDGGWGPEEGRISKLRRLIAITPADDPQKPDFWFRLGQACGWHWHHSVDGHPFSREKRQALFREAVDAYRAATLFPKYDRIDGALFELARLHLAAGDLDSSRRYVDRLAREHASSRYVPKVDLLYADQQVARGERATALAWYSMAEQRAEASTLPYAHYAKAWCFYARGDLDAGRFELAEAVRTADQASNWPWNRIVRRLAERDLGRAP